LITFFNLGFVRICSLFDLSRNVSVSVSGTVPDEFRNSSGWVPEQFRPSSRNFPGTFALLCYLWCSLSVVFIFFSRF
jgi:hypothetical protein